MQVLFVHDVCVRGHMYYGQLSKSLGVLTPPSAVEAGIVVYWL